MNPPLRRTLDRRQFLQLSSATALAAAFGSERVRAAADDSGALYARMVPTHKGLAKDWITSLVKAGHPLDAGLRASHPAIDLTKIGMPVGGIGCGTVYLSGDGRLFIWDIFNQPHAGVVEQQVSVPKGMENIAGGGPKVRSQDGSNYIQPPTPDSYPPPFRQGFELEIAGKTRKFQASDWAEVSFDGKWPVGQVKYADPQCPVQAMLTAWTPFIPLNQGDSTLPVTIMEYLLENKTAAPVAATVRGILENPCCVFSRKQTAVELSSRVMKESGLTLLNHTAAAPKTAAVARPDLPFEDFENGYGKWVTTGTAFGTQPVAKTAVPPYQGNLAMHGKAAVNSHATAPGEEVGARDAATGTLTSPEFTIERKFIRLLIGGGNHAKQTCVNLLIDGKAVRSITGKANNQMSPAVIPVAEFEGKTARLQAVDNFVGPWGNIGLDQIVFSDNAGTGGDLTQLEDYGTMALGLVDHAALSDDKEMLAAAVTVPAGGSVKVTFILAWSFPNLHPLPGLGRRKRAYSTRFNTAAATAWAVFGELPRLREDTLKWVKTYYDSSLPRWLLDRAAATTTTLQTTNCIILDDGRFWAWEGIGCCAGTCAHVWHYAQGPARLFPTLERNLRLVTDFGVAQNPDGAVRFRAESGGIAIDAQTGVVLRTWREHLGSPDAGFLKQAWPGVRKAASWLLEFDRKDPDGLDGLLHGEQHNTLDAEWYGKVHALCSMYLASLRAAEEIARVMDDLPFAQQCRTAFDLGSKKIATLFNGEFYIQEEDPKHSKAIGVGTGCYIDQVIGQWWAHQVGLGRLMDEGNVRTALHNLWKYNFVPDVGPFRQEFKRGRFYALPGEAGLIMCSWPKGGLRPDFVKHWQYAYFNECMSGFEWQAASHMIFEGAPVSGDGFESAIEDASDPRSLTLRGLAIGRAIHDRYAPAKRNPYNEIECSDHYARAAASYAMLLAVSGFKYDGPAGIIGFAPKLNPEQFKCPFTAAAGWGSFEQTMTGTAWQAKLTLHHGSLRVVSLSLPWLAAGMKVRHNDRDISATLKPGTLALAEPLTLQTGDSLTIG